MRTGILGGTFDPIHIAHLHTAETALFQFELDRVLLVPAGRPWQKADRRVTPGETRMEMVRLAIEGVPDIYGDDREIRRPGATYTADTLASFPENEELILILGSDAAAGFRTWHRWEEILERVSIAVAPRPGVGVDEVDLEGAVPLEMGLLEISGTDIRRRVREGRPFRYLLADRVYRFVLENGLYTQGDDDDMVGAT